MPSRLTTATAATGLSAFALLYAPQPVLPQLAAEFGRTPGQASLAVSAATGALALAIVPVASLANRVGRRNVIVCSVLAASVLGLLLPLAPTFEVLLVGRVFQGLATAGVPAVAMAFLVDQLGGAAVGAAVGALIAGNTAGGMVGRLLSGVGADWLDWRGALALTAGFSLVCAVLAAFLLPAETTRPGATGGGLRAALTDRVLLCQYAVAVLAVAAFISLFNVIAFRLTGPPLDLPAGVASLVFLAYAVGGVCSAVAGRLADRHGRAPVAIAALAVTAAGAATTLVTDVVAIAVGLALFTGGFFAAHAVASGWVGVRAPRRARGQAAGVYLFAFYVGSSAGGTAGSTAYGHWGWPGLIAVVLGWLALAVAAVLVAQKSSGTAAEPPAIVTEPWIGSRTEPDRTTNVTERTSGGTSTTSAVGKVSPP
ncbi:MFS transporter [Actinosynnema sp. NPDC020468]|uniref:MFS transporter n=1 Tax=Actinosynnema sp. NPDC020468 TaxID=3154488 RepID=UPI00340DF1EE